MRPNPILVWKVRAEKAERALAEAELPATPASNRGINPLHVRLDQVLADVRGETLEAQNRFAMFNSPHEGWAVIKEELDELWEHVRANQGRKYGALDEARQIAAMAVRYILDLEESGV